MAVNKNILVVGELNLDLILNKIKGFPAVGQEIMADDMNLVMGSSSAIFAANISRLGIPVSFCGMVGNDSFGRTIIDELGRKNIDTRYIAISEDAQTGITVVMNYAEDRANVTYGGAMEIFTADRIPVDRIADFSHFHLSSYFLQKGLREKTVDLFRLAKNSGLSTSLDIQWDPANEWNFPYETCLPYVDIFLPNEAELLLLSGTRDVNEALSKMGKYANKIVVKQGTRGALVYSQGDILRSKAFIQDNFVDAIGAGDSFNAGFISRHLQGASLVESLRFANICGAMNTTAPGGTAAFDDINLFRSKVKTLFNIDLSI